jgi:hypothetical protein
MRGHLFEDKINIFLGTKRGGGMVEYGLLLSSVSEFFTSFAWQLKSILNQTHWLTLVAICAGVFIFIYYLLRNR